MRVLGYYGHRTVEQFLSIPVATQTPATSAGGVVDLNRKFGGGDARWSWEGELAGRPLSWVIGASYDRQNELRQGYNNFVGTTLGVKGALRRDENNISSNVDEYTQGTWDFAEMWSLTAGVRHSEVTFRSEDHFIAGTNLDDSGEIDVPGHLPRGGSRIQGTPLAASVCLVRAGLSDAARLRARISRGRRRWPESRAHARLAATTASSA